jgi:hypothetical protein
VSKIAEGSLRVAIASLVVVCAVGCSEGPDSSGGGDSRSTLAERESARPFVRGCDPRVGSGRLPTTRHDLVLGHLRLYFADQHAPVRAGGVLSAGKRLDGEWRAFKTLVILNGTEGTLRVAPADHSNFLLAYDPSRVRNFAHHRSDGQAAVRFVNCARPRRDLEFPGSLLARRPGCYRLQELSADGRVIATGLINIAMGEGRCRELCYSTRNRYRLSGDQLAACPFGLTTSQRPPNSSTSWQRIVPGASST